MPNVIVELNGFTFDVNIKKHHTFAYDFTVIAALSSLVKINRQEVDRVRCDWRLFNSHWNWQNTDVHRVDGAEPSDSLRRMFHDFGQDACKLAIVQQPDWETQAKLEFIDERINIQRQAIFEAQDNIVELNKERNEIVTAEILDHVKKLEIKDGQATA